MSSSHRLLASHASVEEAVNERLGGDNSVGFAAHMQSVLRADPLLNTLSANGSTKDYAQKRARELVTQIYQEDTEKHIHRVNQELAAHGAKVKELEEDLITKAEEVANSKLVLKEAEARLIKLRSENHSLTSELQVTRERVSAAEDSAQQAQAELRSEQDARSHLHQQIEDLENASRIQQKDVNEKIMELEHIKLECSKLQAQLHEGQRCTQQLKDRQSHAETSMNASISDMKQALTKAQMDVEAAQQGEKEAETAAHQAEAQVQQLRKANRLLKADVREAESLVRRADQERCAHYTSHFITFPRVSANCRTASK
jgi:chromosome segregation ATPase